MVLPIVAYGHPTLRKVAQPIDPGYFSLRDLISDMFETMYSSGGVGLAAPQVNRSIRLFVVDTTPFNDEITEMKDFKRAFINPVIIEEYGDEWVFNEGCLSIPDIREDVSRKANVKLRYQDEEFNIHEEEFSGVIGRVIQHEYDHLEGKLLVDRISGFKKILLKGKLTDISNGKTDADYKMIFPSKKFKK